MSVSVASGLARQVDRAVLSITLAFGAAAFAALVGLTLTLRDHGFAFASLVYGASLVACALCSFLYNMLETARRRELLRVLDHAAIFLLIAGTYTPFAARGIEGPFHVSLLAWVWALAAAGIVLKLISRRAHDRAFVAVYLAIGWLFVISFDAVIRSVPPLPLGFLALGGLVYTVGAVIYTCDIGRWTDPVWHSCVLAGIIAHFLAVFELCVFAGFADG